MAVGSRNLERAQDFASRLGVPRAFGSYDALRGVSVRALARGTGLSRNTVRAALRSPVPPRYERAPAGSKLDPYKDEICRLLRREPGFRPYVCEDPRCSSPSLHIAPS